MRLTLTDLPLALDVSCIASSLEGGALGIDVHLWLVLPDAGSYPARTLRSLQRETIMFAPVPVECWA